MPHLLSLTRRPGPESDEPRFPFTVPAIAALTTLDLSAPVTLLVGENGSGKSTLLESLAIAAELTAVGSYDLARDGTLEAQRALAAELRLAWSRRSRKGFFLRAEDFFGYLKQRAIDDARLAREAGERGGSDNSVPLEGLLGADLLAADAHIAAHDARSHGESFLDLFVARVRPGGLYLLDEPEAPLSPQRQLALLGLVLDAARGGAQFVIATHSPILLACPGARILSFDTAPIGEVAFEELEHVRLTRDFLNDPERYLRALRD